MTINKKLFIEDLKKVPGLLFAFVFCAYGIAQMKSVNIGMNSWATLNLGLTNITGLNFGVLTQLVGLTIILFSLTLKIYPGLGTILNMYFIGFFVDIIDTYHLSIVPENYILKIAVLFLGLIVFNYGIYAYLRFELGAGPRDGLMVGLVKLTGISVKFIKPAIELTVLLIGFLLGGTVGLGTILVTFCGGYVLEQIFRWKNFSPKKTNQRKLSDYIVKDQERNKDFY